MRNSILEVNNNVLDTQRDFIVQVRDLEDQVVELSVAYNNALKEIVTLKRKLKTMSEYHDSFVRTLDKADKENRVYFDALLETRQILKDTISLFGDYEQVNGLKKAVNRINEVLKD